MQQQRGSGAGEGEGMGGGGGGAARGAEVGMEAATPCAMGRKKLGSKVEELCSVEPPSSKQMEQKMRPQGMGCWGGGGKWWGREEAAAGLRRGAARGFERGAKSGILKWHMQQEVCGR